MGLGFGVGRGRKGWDLGRGFRFISVVQVCNSTEWELEKRIFCAEKKNPAYNPSGI